MTRLQRILVPRHLRDDPRYKEDFGTRVILAVSLRLGFLLLIPALVAIAFTAKESIDRTQANRVLIERLEMNAVELRRTAKQLAANERDQARQRLANRARFQRTDVLVCLGLERLKATERRRARRSFRELDQTLELLQLEKTPAIVAAAKRNLRRTLREHAPRKCGELPSLKAPPD